LNNKEDFNSFYEDQNKFISKIFSHILNDIFCVFVLVSNILFIF